MSTAQSIAVFVAASASFLTLFLAVLWRRPALEVRFVPDPANAGDAVVFTIYVTNVGAATFKARAQLVVDGRPASPVAGPRPVVPTGKVRLSCRLPRADFDRVEAGARLETSVMYGPWWWSRTATVERGERRIL